MSRPIALVAGLLVLGAALVVTFTASVYADRGRYEINLSSIHEVPVGPGETLTQPVPLQRSAPYAIDLPYVWRGSHPACIEVRLVAADGSVISDTTETVDNSRAPLWLEPVGDGSYWQHERAAFHFIRIPSGASGTVVLQLTRVDQEAGTLVFFASDLPAPDANASPAELRPTLVERPKEILELQTEYGAPEPAFAKVPTYVSRVQSLAPPWLPFPLPELVLAGMVAIGVFLYTKVLSDQPAQISLNDE